MLGWLTTQGDGPLRPEVRRLCGLRVWHAAIPAAGGGNARRVARVCRRLKKAGVRRVLTEEAFEYWDVVGEQGLAPVEPMPLYRAMAGQAALAVLKKRGLAPRVCAVRLSGRWADPELTAAAHYLCPRVAAVMTDADGGENLTRLLYRTYGAAPPSPATPIRLTLSFSPDRAGDLRLWGGGSPEGLELACRGIALYPDIQPDRLIAALWQGGVCGTDQIEVLVNKIP